MVNLLKIVEMNKILYILLVLTLIVCVYTLDKTNEAEEQCQQDIAEWINETPCVDKCIKSSIPKLNVTYDLPVYNMS